MKQIEISTPGGKLLADASDDVCLKFGFRSGDIIETCFGEEAIVMGVATVPTGRNSGRQALFYKKDDNVSYYFKPGNIKDEGFKLQDAEKVIQKKGG